MRLHGSQQFDFNLAKQWPLLNNCLTCSHCSNSDCFLEMGGIGLYRYLTENLNVEEIVFFMQADEDSRV